MTQPASALQRSGAVPLPDGGQLYYEVHGEAVAGRPPLLLLRPLGGSIPLWDSFREILARDLQVISFDPRGAGRSSAPALWTTTRGMAGDALALLDALRCEKAHVLGLSMGGMVAQWLAIDAPGRLVRLVLASTVPRGLDVSRGGIERGLRLSRCLLHPAREAEVCLVRRVLSQDFRRDHPSEVARYLAIVRAEPASRWGLLAQVGAIAGHDTRACLHKISALTLVLAGARDQLLDHQAQRRLAWSVPGARFAVIPGAGHDLSLEAPAASVEQILPFLRGA